MSAVLRPITFTPSASARHCEGRRFRSTARLVRTPAIEPSVRLPVHLIGATHLLPRLAVAIGTHVLWAITDHAAGATATETAR